MLSFGIKEPSKPKIMVSLVSPKILVDFISSNIRSKSNNVNLVPSYSGSEKLDLSHQIHYFVSIWNHLNNHHLAKDC